MVEGKANGGKDFRSTYEGAKIRVGPKTLYKLLSGGYVNELG